jgi:hypothetical protein
LTVQKLTARQQSNAESIIAAALPYGTEAVLAALIAAGAESSWLRYANDGSSTRTDVSLRARQIAATSLAYDHDAVAGSAWTTADSVGLYQQRPMFGYGTVAELMDPARSTVIFVAGNGRRTNRYFLQAPADLPLPARVQWTQGSEYPTGENYEPHVDTARYLLNKYLAAHPAPPSRLESGTPTPNTEGMDTDMGLIIMDPATGWRYAVAPGYFEVVNDDIYARLKDTGLFKDGPAWNNVQLIERRRLLTGLTDEQAGAAGKGIYVADAAGGRFA